MDKITQKGGQVGVINHMGPKVVTTGQKRVLLDIFGEMNNSKYICWPLLVLYSKSAFLLAV